MKIETGIGWAKIHGAEGTVWDEAFTFEQCQELCNFLDSQLTTALRTPLLSSVERLRDMFYALINDSDACVVHCTSVVNGAVER